MCVCMSDAEQYMVLGQHQQFERLARVRDHNRESGIWAEDVRWGIACVQYENEMYSFGAIDAASVCKSVTIVAQEMKYIRISIRTVCLQSGD